MKLALPTGEKTTTGSGTIKEPSGKTNMKRKRKKLTIQYER